MFGNDLDGLTDVTQCVFVADISDNFQLFKSKEIYVAEVAG